MSLEIFFSYSHVDEKYRRKIDTHLSTLKRLELITSWSDHKILAGSSLDKEIAEQLEAAKVILLLISPDFIGSDYCFSVELKRAIERHNAGTAQVIPIIARPCDWRGLPFSDLKALPKDGKPITKWSPQDTAYADIALGLRTVVTALASASERTVEVEPTNSEKVKLEAVLSIAQDNNTIRRVGCPCLVVSLVCKSRRSAKVEAVRLHVRGPHIFPAFQRAFSTDLGPGPNPVFLEDPTYSLKFFPATQRNTVHGHIINRDDRLEFFLPSVNGILLQFTESPPSDTFISVDYLDGGEETLVAGVSIQSRCLFLLRRCLEASYSVRPIYTPEMGTSIKPLQQPDVPNEGFYNDERLDFPPHPRRDDDIDEESNLIRFRAKVLRSGGERDKRSLPWLLDVAENHNDRETRRDALVALQYLPDLEVRKVLFRILKTETNEQTRALVIRGLGMAGVQDDLANLKQIKLSETSRFCKEAADFAYNVLLHRLSTQPSANPRDQ